MSSLWAGICEQYEQAWKTKDKNACGGNFRSLCGNLEMEMTELYGEELKEEDTQRGRYLTFTLEDNTYGVPILFVTEIIGIQHITKVPETPDFIKGITNLRGKIIPLIDVRLKFGKSEIPYNERTCIIVIETNGMAVGLIVDKVDDVVSIEESQIASAPEARIGFETRYIAGIGHSDGGILLLLDLDRFLKHGEIEMMESIAEFAHE